MLKYLKKISNIWNPLFLEEPAAEKNSESRLSFSWLTAVLPFTYLLKTWEGSHLTAPSSTRQTTLLTAPQKPLRAQPESNTSSYRDETHCPWRRRELDFLFAAICHQPLREINSRLHTNRYSLNPDLIYREFSCNFTFLLPHPRSPHLLLPTFTLLSSRFLQSFSVSVRQPFFSVW